MLPICAPFGVIGGLLHGFMLSMCDPFGVIGGFSMALCYRYVTPSGSLAASTGLHVTDIRPLWGHCRLPLVFTLPICSPFGVIGGFSMATCYRCVTPSGSSLILFIFHFYYTRRFADSLLQVHQVDSHAPMAEEDGNGFHKRALLLVHQR